MITLLFGAAVGIVQRDVKRMLAYSSINHAGFVLLGLYLVTVRGVSGSLYYLFTYTFMVIGSFAVITVMAGLGDSEHSLDSYRGLARRQPWLAVPMVILLLAQAGLPATTGLWAKIYVIEGVVGTPGGDALAVIAMVSAVVAAFFYLRLVLYMVSSPLTPAGAEGGAEGSSSWDTGSVASADGLEDSPSGDVEVSEVAPRGIATLETISGTSTGIGAESGVLGNEPVVPLSVATGIAICTGVTVLFGVWPSPIINFAHAATLLLH